MKSGEVRGFITFLIVLIIIVILLIGLGMGGYYYMQRKGIKTVLPKEPVIESVESVTANMKRYGVKAGDPVFLRILKEPKLLELWMKPESGTKYKLVQVFPVLSQSGVIGPKTREGDWQAPEGFYRTHVSMLNPNSQYHLSFNIGYPNAYDKALKRTGSFIMVHGGAQSRGCFAMGDPAIEVLYGLVESYLKTPEGKKKGVPIQIYPFVPHEARMRYEMGSPHYSFWRFLQEAWDYTEQHHHPAPVRFDSKTGEMIMDQRTQ